ncbi:MAG: hypothetical protein EA420_04545 [Candidatus Competibacteraceae bacterium]|nr:MAG: hypothetical protein EA420_04545 [Candidatus Competibacteraceae bacterium]
MNAQEVSNTGTGTAVFVPYYTINDGWRTLVNITNTSANSLAIKFRLHEARNSRDVLDFVVLLSPYDVWTAWVEEGADGRPFLQTTDRSCTVPISVRDSGANASELAYSNSFRDHLATDGDISRMSEGYIEVLVMGETEGEGEAPVDGNRGSTAWYAKHVNGEPRNCGFIQNDFVRRTATWTRGPADAPNDIPGEDGSGDPLARLGSGDPTSTVGYGEIDTPAPLKVNASLVNRANGIAAGIESLHIAGWGDNQNLVTAQQFPWFLEPSLASSDGLWTTEALDDINEGIAAFTVANEWTNNPNTGALSDWVVTFPTKRFQTDEDALNIQAACSVWRNDGSEGGEVNGEFGDVWDGWPDGATRPNQLAEAECPDLGFPNVFQDGNDGRADLSVQYDIFDREEGSITVTVDGPVVSPAPPPDVTIDNLPYEVNVLKIGRNAANLPSALDSLISLAIDTSALASNAESGWLRITYLGDGEFAGYPTTGFIFKARDFGNPMLNFGQATEHAYTRELPAPPIEPDP